MRVDIVTWDVELHDAVMYRIPRFKGMIGITSRNGHMLLLIHTPASEVLISITLVSYMKDAVPILSHDPLNLWPLSTWAN